MQMINLAGLPQYADALADEGWFVIPDAINQQAVSGLNEAISKSKEAAVFKKAGIGAGADFQFNNDVRGDFIHWISRHPQEAVLQEWMQSMTALRVGLNRELFFGSAGY